MSTIITIGNFELKWYSFLLLVSFTLGSILIFIRSKKLNLNKNQILDLLFYLILFAIIGARIYYVVFNLDYYLKYPIEIIKVWEGGLAIHGGIIAGFIYLIYFCKKNKISILSITDLVVPSLALGQAIGRWGNFFNQEAYGPIVKYEILKRIHIPNFIINGMYIDNNYHYPTFLFESIWCFLIFIVILILIRLKKEKLGLYTSIYLIMYGIERFIIESLRQDSLMLFNLRIAQIVSIIMIIIGIFILILGRRKKID